MSLFQRLKEGLTRSRRGLTERLAGLFQGKASNEEILEGLEEALITADVGVTATRKLLEALGRQSQVRWGNDPDVFASCLQDEIVRILTDTGPHETRVPRYSARPWVILFVGVNGAGKTTTIGKLAEQHRREGKKVILAAGDTFRAAAIEQLEIWGQRAGAEVIRHQHGQDPSGVAFDAVHAARKRDADIVLIDTAGRLHTKTPLVEELKKIVRVVGREFPGAPHETLLVLDATTGQNALQQARVFKESLGVTGIVLTKLDGTAKGGVVLGIQEELRIPVAYVGVGESVEDLQPFEPAGFARALFSANP